MIVASLVLQPSFPQNFWKYAVLNNEDIHEMYFCPPSIGMFPCSPNIENLFSYVPCSQILSLFPCSPQNLAFVPLK